MEKGPVSTNTMSSGFIICPKTLRLSSLCFSSPRNPGRLTTLEIAYSSQKLQTHLAQHLESCLLLLSTFSSALQVFRSNSQESAAPDSKVGSSTYQVCNLRQYACSRCSSVCVSGALCEDEMEYCISSVDQEPRTKKVMSRHWRPDLTNTAWVLVPVSCDRL